MASPTQNQKMNKKADITLMTLLAYEATDGSRKILKEYGATDARNHKDLELKLAELYFKTPDKKTLEKKLADIHPHKKWIIKNVEPTETKPEIIIPEVETKSNFNDNDFPTMQNPYMNAQMMSSFDSQNKNEQFPQWTQYIGPIMLVSIIGLTYFMILKTVDKK